jgi:large subunit ribosomal protein L17
VQIICTVLRRQQLNKMRHGKKHNHLGRKAEHRQALLANLTIALITHKRITTTLAKAKALRVHMEPLVTKAKDDSTHNRRVVFSYLQNKEAIKELFDVIGPKIGDRPGGYLRIMRMSLARPGDQADMALIEWVEESLVNAYQETKKAPAKKAGKAGKKVKAAKSDDADESTDAKETAKTQKKAGKKETKKS